MRWHMPGHLPQGTEWTNKCITNVSQNHNFPDPPNHQSKPPTHTTTFTSSTWLPWEWGMIWNNPADPFGKYDNLWLRVETIDHWSAKQFLKHNHMTKPYQWIGFWIRRILEYWQSEHIQSRKPDRSQVWRKSVSVSNSTKHFRVCVTCRFSKQATSGLGKRSAIQVLNSVSLGCSGKIVGNVGVPSRQSQTKPVADGKWWKTRCGCPRLIAIVFYLFVVYYTIVLASSVNSGWLLWYLMTRSRQNLVLVN